MKLRILDSEWRAFVDELCARTDVEIGRHHLGRKT